MILHIEFTHLDDQPIVRGTVEIPDMPEKESDAIKRLIYMKQTIVISGANKLKMIVTHRNWKKVYLPVPDKRVRKTTTHS